MNYKTNFKTFASRPNASRRPRSRHFTQNLANDAKYLIELDFVYHQRRTKGNRLADGAHEHATLPGLRMHFLGARAWRTGARRKFDCPDEAKIAGIDHLRQTLVSVNPLLERACQARRVAEQVGTSTLVLTTDRAASGHLRQADANVSARKRVASKPKKAAPSGRAS